MTLKVFVIAGEASGDQLGAALILSLKEQNPDMEIRGIGGAAMLDAGLSESLFEMQELSVMGIAEILPKLPKFINLIAKTVQAIRGFDPDVVITIDSPDFSFRVQKKIKAAGVRARKIHYVAPTVWAWRGGRAAKVAQFLDGMICLFPFEPIYFEREGLRAVAVGHPMVDSGLLQGNGLAFRERHGIEVNRKVLGIFCGSRTSEIRGLSPVMIETAKQIREKYPDILCVVPTLPIWKEELEFFFKGAGLEAIVTADPEEKWDAFKAPDVALAVSGTVALEIALAGVPHALIYKMGGVTWEIVKRVVKTKFAHLGNILLGHLVYPEFIQEKATPGAIAPVVDSLLSSGVERKIQIEASRKILLLLQPNPNERPSDRAASFVLSLVR